MTIIRNKFYIGQQVTLVNKGVGVVKAILLHSSDDTIRYTIRVDNNWDNHYVRESELTRVEEPKREFSTWDNVRFNAFPNRTYVILSKHVVADEYVIGEIVDGRHVKDYITVNSRRLTKIEVEFVPTSRFKVGDTEFVVTRIGDNG